MESKKSYGYSGRLCWRYVCCKYTSNKSLFPTVNNSVSVEDIPEIDIRDSNLPHKEMMLDEIDTEENLNSELQSDSVGIFNEKSGQLDEETEAMNLSNRTEADGTSQTYIKKKIEKH